MSRFWGHGRRGTSVAGSAFTLIELLTVIAIVAVLASLFLASVASAKKKSRATVCTFNLHQISLAVNMYADEEGKHPSVDALAASKYLPNPASLLCPEDKTGNWGGIVNAMGVGSIINGPIGANPGTVRPVNYSYLLFPLAWDEDTWKHLMRLGGPVGISACQLHGLGRQDTPDIHNYSGLLLRGQRDGAVVRRQFFWAASLVMIGAPGSPSLAVPMGNGEGFGGLMDPASVLPLYLDDTSTWQQTGP